jgi:hypothetical protein
MPAVTPGMRPRDELYRMLNRPQSTAEWRGIMRELLGYRAREPHNRALIEALKKELGR